MNIKKTLIRDENFTLSNNNLIPKIGFGTWQIENDLASFSVKTALTNGYRHIDTAIDYGNEVGVGKGIKESGIDRKEIFVTSKIPASIKTYEEAKRCIKESLERLDLEYLDLMLIHSPRPWEILWDESAPRYYEENIEVYKALEEAYFEGKIKNIGLSNFFIKDVDNILNNCKVKPVVNQICVYIGNTPLELINYCIDKNILVEAYSPFATGRITNNNTLKEIALKYNVSIPKLCLKYCLDINTLPLPKSTNYKHIIDNLDVDFDIDSKDIERLKKLKITL